MIDGNFECDRNFPLDLISEYITIEQKTLIDVDRNTGKEYNLTFKILRHPDYIHL
jgi:hypothetical protein